ncbi:MAG: single-stranded-DNA-specific exonuclease RecJ [Spirochaetes bacterium]|nr:single-stranded-DNA-specific exonuclease RecJ [Spirochaetota bacterium]
MNGIWKVKSSMNVDRTGEGRQYGPEEILARILESRGIDTPIAIDEYLNPRIMDLHSPFLFGHMEESVSRMRRAISSRETIGIFADSDLDGITAMVTLHSLLSRLGAVMYLRHLQDDEQYGLTRGIIDEFARQDVTLLITVDSGIRDVAEIEYAASRGIETIVTDHHEEDTRLPQGLILNPRISSSGYPYRDLAGVGVVFKLCIGLLFSYLPSYNKRFILVEFQDGKWKTATMVNGVITAMDSFSDSAGLLGICADNAEYGAILVAIDTATFDSIPQAEYGCPLFSLSDLAKPAMKGSTASSFAEICTALSLVRDLYPDSLSLAGRIVLFLQMAVSPKIMGFIEEAAGYAAIGSIADVVPLTGENRVIVSHGIRSLEATSHPGLSLLVGNGPVNARKIGWGIAPLLNAPGRVGKTALTLNFFLEHETARSREILREIESLNSQRKSSVSELCVGLIDEYRKGGHPHRNIVVLQSDRIAEGYAGLVANRISDSLEKPVIAISLQRGSGAVKGSGRCRNGLDFFSYIKPFSEHFERIGGHAQAFGFTIAADRIDRVTAMIDDSMEGVASAIMPLEIDLELPLDSVTLVLIQRIVASMEPFGKGNEAPLFCSRSLAIESFARFGNGSHGKYCFKGYPHITAIGWNMADPMEALYATGGDVDIVYSVEVNEFLGRKEPRMVITAVEPGNLTA